jgi:hypothetical protein
MMVLDIATSLVNDANARHYPNLECNDFGSSMPVMCKQGIPRRRSRQDPVPVPSLAFQPQEGKSISRARINHPEIFS